MSKKSLIIGGVILAVLAAVVSIVLYFYFREEQYRSIKVFEVNGECSVDRGKDSLKAFKDMSLSSGDVFTVAEDGFARLKLDEDKYVYLQPDTRVRLTASGNEKNSRTMVFVERGSMTTEVQKKLSAKSTYDIVTPNTTMAIRGTITHTNVTIEDNGSVCTSSAVVEGKVDYTVYKKGKNGETIAVEKALGEGDGYSVETDREDLLDEKVLEEIAESGLKASENDDVTVMTPEEAEIEFKAPAFSEKDLNYLQGLLGQLGKAVSDLYSTIMKQFGDGKFGGYNIGDLYGGGEGYNFGDLYGGGEGYNFGDLYGGGEDYDFGNMYDGGEGFNFGDIYSDGEGIDFGDLYGSDFDLGEDYGSGDYDSDDYDGEIPDFNPDDIDTEAIGKAIESLKGLFGN